MQLDGFDLKILNLLESDGRMSWKMISEQVNLSASACQRRVQSLQEKGIIRHFTFAYNHIPMGYEIRAFVQVKITRHDNKTTKQFKDAVLTYPEVSSCYKMTGNTDFILDVVAKDLKSFGLFIENKILYLPGVIDAISAMVLENVKEHRQAI